MEPASSKHYKYMYCSVDEVEVISVLITLTVKIQSKPDSIQNYFASCRANLEAGRTELHYTITKTKTKLIIKN